MRGLHIEIAIAVDQVDNQSVLVHDHPRSDILGDEVVAANKYTLLALNRVEEFSARMVSVRLDGVYKTGYSLLEDLMRDLSDFGRGHCF